jgi:hypothetical protein
MKSQTTGVISGKRPARLTHLSLTDDLWGITERFWDRDLQRRPEISEMVLPVRAAFALRHGRVDVNDDQATDDTTLAALNGSCCRLVSYISLLFRRWYLTRLKGPRFDRLRAQRALPHAPSYLWHGASLRRLVKSVRGR